jgi:hypothetical protein
MVYFKKRSAEDLISAVLSAQCIARFGGSECISGNIAAKGGTTSLLLSPPVPLQLQFPLLTQLDLSRNLLVAWEELIPILRLTPALVFLDLSHNRWG